MALARTGDVLDVECGLYGAVAAVPPPLDTPLLAAPPTETCGVSFPSRVTILHRSQDGAVVIHRAFRQGCRRLTQAEAGRSCFEWCSSIRVAAPPALFSDEPRLQWHGGREGVDTGVCWKLRAPIASTGEVRTAMEKRGEVLR